MRWRPWKSRLTVEIELTPEHEKERITKEQEELKEFIKFKTGLEVDIFGRGT